MSLFKCNNTGTSLQKCSPCILRLQSIAKLLAPINLYHNVTVFRYHLQSSYIFFFSVLNASFNY